VAAAARAVTATNLGAWLIKARPDGLPLDDLVKSGFRGLTSRCVRPTYRTGLVREDQPVLLWVSGGDPRYPSGIYATGRTTGPAGPVQHELAMPLRLRAVSPVVLREELMSQSGLSELEVLRMPAGSNPSYLDKQQFSTLQRAFAQLSRQ
jgi:hypothetical protein